MLLNFNKFECMIKILVTGIYNIPNKLHDFRGTDMVLHLKKWIRPALSIEFIRCLDRLSGDKENWDLRINLNFDARARIFTGKCLTRFLVQDSD